MSRTKEGKSRHREVCTTKARCYWLGYQLVAVAIVDDSSGNVTVVAIVDDSSLKT
jgi:hypothetical protein